MHQNATQDGCAFFRLAPEIRAKVYKQVFADATVGYRAKQKKRGYTSENRVIRGTLKDRFAATSILWTCRQCYQEAKPILHSEATLKIMSDTPITKDTAFYTHSRSFKNLQMEHVYRLSNLSPDWQKTHVDDALRSFPNTNTLILGEIYVEFSNPNGLFPGAFFRSGINIHDAVQLAWKADPLKSAWRKATQAISGEAMIENCRYLIRIRFQLPHQRPPAGSYSNWLIGVSTRALKSPIYG